MPKKNPTKKSLPKKTTAKAKSANSTKANKPQNSLVANINRRKKAGKSRREKDSTISTEAYADMEAGWPNKGKSQSSKRKQTAKKKPS